MLLARMRVLPARSADIPEARTLPARNADTPRPCAGTPLPKWDPARSAAPLAIFDDIDLPEYSYSRGGHRPAVARSHPVATRRRFAASGRITRHMCAAPGLRWPRAGRCRTRSGPSRRTATRQNSRAGPAIEDLASILAIVRYARRELRHISFSVRETPDLPR
jgi:hypothetical protein